MSKKKHRKKHKRPFIKPVDKKIVAPEIKTPVPTAPVSVSVPETSVPPAVVSLPNKAIPKPVVTPALKTAVPQTAAPKAALQETRPLKKRDSRLESYLLLMRIDRPIGILLLLWPTYWTLWLAAEGIPSAKNLLIFAWGCILMRSAGCVMNDYADRHIDDKVKRTKDRMIVAGKVSPKEALILFFVLCAIAFALVCLTNKLTIILSVGGLLLAVIYPFSKRYTHLPQVVLGIAFAWSIPMAWTAQHMAIDNSTDFKSVLEAKMWLIYLAVVLWALIYDTFYAMVDRDDDIKIGVKSTAILFGDADRVITALLQGLMIFTLILIGRKFGLGLCYYASLVIASMLFIYQQKLIKDRNRDLCFKAFLNNNYVGLVVFVGIVIDYYFKNPVF
jgi:4-hydroxybenzoate polyprenyltransferase